MTNGDPFDAILGRSRGSDAGWRHAPAAARPHYNPFEPASFEFVEPAREYVAVLNANSGAVVDGEEPFRIPTEDMVGENAVDDFGGPGDFCAAGYGLLIEPWELAPLVGSERRKPVGRSFAVYPVDPADTGFIGLLVEHAASGTWSLLVPDVPEAEPEEPAAA